MRTRECSSLGLAMFAITVLATGCLDRELKPLNPCLVSGVSRKVQVKNVDKVDLLFMVDNSNSMAGEQNSLKAQFPNVIKVLTTGKRNDADMDPFPPTKDLHVGVVSSDMGIPGVNYGACHADGGDDGKLQHSPHGAACDATYPLFLSYNGDSKSGMALTDPTKFSNDVGCVAALGTGGCGFEEQLEAPFKALWPQTYMDANGNIVANKFTFLSINMDGTHGKGDVPENMGGNLGFLRNDPARGLSLIAVVVVTDEEDCSVRTAEHLWPANILPPGSPYLTEDINLRCFKHKEFLYDVKNRYYNGFRALRTGNEELVVFAAITGVPEDTVDKEALARVDFDNEAQRNQFYDNILGDPRMQEVEDPSTMPGMGMGNLKPSCVRPVQENGETVLSTAYPPRRIVELAKLFGRNGVVQSICQDNFGPAMEAIINVIAKQLGEVCLPRPLVRQRSGLVACNVVWELPKMALQGSGTPVECGQSTFLKPVDQGRAAVNAAGGNNCKVEQLPVIDTSAKLAPAGEGWYYDNYTMDLMKTCSKTQQQRVAFTSGAKPPTGVTVKLECLNETQKLPDTRTTLANDQQPEIGTACGKDMTGTMTGPSGDDACKVTLQTGAIDMMYPMFCHPNQNVCVRMCRSDTDCPPAWVCDNRESTLKIEGLNGRAYCVNPTCGADTDTGG